jgi:hypothetical protein
MSKDNKEETCVELKNIKYKSMLFGGPQHETKTTDNINNLDKFLENDHKNNNSLNDQPWSKLDKTIKLKKLLAYCEVFALEQIMSEEEKRSLITFLKDCLDRKKLQRIKDVDYDKTTGEIKSIPVLCYMKSTKHFTLKNIDKRVSTLKSLPPKKVIKAVVGKLVIDKEEKQEEEEQEANLIS